MIPGTEVMKMALGENPKGCYGPQKRMPMTRMGIGAVLRETLFNAKQYSDEMAEAEKEGKPVRKEPSIYANRMTEIKSNKEYFESHGISLEEEADKESSKENDDFTVVSKISEALENMDVSESADEKDSATEEIPKSKLPEIKVDLDADYFRWKEEQEKESQESGESSEEKPEEGAVS